MTDMTSAPASSDLERGYRRLIACYPRSFRKDNEEEILTVLLATAGEGQRRPGLSESADLIKGAYAPAALISSGVNWVIGLAAVVLILQKQSGPYFVRRPATR
jgi:hypothetical protein